MHTYHNIYMIDKDVEMNDGQQVQISLILYVWFIKIKHILSLFWLSIDLG